jgi:acyl-CoA synthetase (AMP-forming)/AMP-acid ligase II
MPGASPIRRSHDRRQAGVPGPALDGKSVYELIESEKVTFAAGVPTVWQMLLGHMRAGGLKFSSLKRTVIGGSACPPAMITAFNDVEYMTTE